MHACIPHREVASLLHCAAVTAPASGKEAAAPSSGDGSAGGQGGSGGLSSWFRNTREKVTRPQQPDQEGCHDGEQHTLKLLSAIRCCALARTGSA